MRSLVFTLAMVLSGCGGSLLDEPLRMDFAHSPETDRPMPPKVTPPPGALFRKDVNAAVEDGLGYFLQRVSVDPDLAEGKFQGFRIVELRPPEFWQGVDLKPGDVVVQVNGMSIERDIDAYQAFQGLRAAPELRVTFMRAGVKRELVYAIVDQDGKKPAAAPAAPPPAAPAAKPNASG